MTAAVAFAVELDDPRNDDVRALLERHLAFCRATSPPEDVHALDLDGLTGHDVSFFSLRTDGQVLGVGALKVLDDEHVEIKSMHTAEEARGRGIARALLAHLLDVAEERGARRVSLETGTMDEFAPARALYASAGFEPTGPFADYWESPNSTFMTRALPREVPA
jgi:putative acetyltransferase